MTTLPFVAPPGGGALIASSNSALREQVLSRLNGRCRPVHQVLGGADALVKLEKGNWQVLFLDRRLPDLDAEELIAIIERRFGECGELRSFSAGRRRNLAGSLPQGGS